MIDEIDKMGADFRGDPASAMLEVLDPEQNATFRDHYLDVPFDLSQGHVHHDGQHARHGPRPAARPHGGDPARRLHRGGEAPDRQAATSCRARSSGPASRSRRSRSPTRACARSSRSARARPACATSSARSAPPAARSRAASPRATLGRKVTVTAPRVRELLGRPRFQPRRAAHAACRASRPGWRGRRSAATCCSSRRRAMPGKGKLTVTGQLGDVMKESAQAALSWVRGHAELDDDWFSTHDVHVHVPAGAVPKDGPSAGITMATALMSLVTGRPVRDDAAMTGEITLTGQVLPIGGLKEKTLAAQRAGITRVIAPRRNEPDLEDIPAAPARATSSSSGRARSRRCSRPRWRRRATGGYRRPATRPQRRIAAARRSTRSPRSSVRLCARCSPAASRGASATCCSRCRSASSTSASWSAGSPRRSAARSSSASRCSSA